MQIRFEDGKLFYLVNTGNEFEMRALLDNDFLASQYLFDVHFDFSQTDSEEITLDFSLPEMGIQQELIKE